MAKKKRRSRSRRKGGKKKGGPKAKPAAAMVGVIGSGIDFLLIPDKKYSGTVLTYAKNVVKGTQPIDGLGRVAVSKLTDLNTYKYAGYGLAGSASKQWPGIRIIARPIDTQLKKLSKGKWGL